MLFRFSADFTRDGSIKPVAVPGEGNPSVLVQNTQGVKLSQTKEGFTNLSKTWGYFQLSWGERQPGFHPCLVLRRSCRAAALAAMARECGVGVARHGSPVGPRLPGDLRRRYGREAR